MKRRPKLLLKANAKNKIKIYYFFLSKSSIIYLLRVDKIIIINPENIGIL